MKICNCALPYMFTGYDVCKNCHNNEPVVTQDAKPITQEFNWYTVNTDTTNVKGFNFDRTV